MRGTLVFHPPCIQLCKVTRKLTYIKLKAIKNVYGKTLKIWIVHRNFSLLSFGEEAEEDEESIEIVAKVNADR